VCGIAGTLSLREHSSDELELQARQMSAQMVHRGPDDTGTWIDSDAGIALAHRRLSILDLSALGRQPMVSANGRWIIVFNGEIYNHHRLRTELQESRYPFVSSTDTETLVAAIQEWGPCKALSKIRGMFAFGLWDRRERSLILARDRMGEKPLYVGFEGPDFFFASELRPIHTIKEFQRSLDRASISCLLTLGYIREPNTIYNNVWKVPAGSFITVKQPAESGSFSFDDVLGTTEKYWNHIDAAIAGSSNLYQSDSEAIADILSTAKQAVTEQLVADVPIGAFLSGGLDSSLVCALAAEASPGRLKTFTI